MLYKVFTTPNCSFCSRVIQILENHKLPYTVYDRTAENKKYLYDLAPHLEDLPILTYPQVFGPGDKYIGGCDKFLEYDEQCLWGTGQ